MNGTFENYNRVRVIQLANATQQTYCIAVNLRQRQAGPASCLTSGGWEDTSILAHLLHKSILVQFYWRMLLTTVIMIPTLQCHLRTKLTANATKPADMSKTVLSGLPKRHLHGGLADGNGTFETAACTWQPPLLESSDHATSTHA